MPEDQDGALLYTSLRSTTLPLALGCSVHLPEVPKEVLKVTATVQELTGEVTGTELELKGSLAVLVRYVVPGGRLRLTEAKSIFGGRLPLAEELPAGHLELAAEVQDITFTLSTVHPRQARLEVKVHGQLNCQVMGPYRPHTPFGDDPGALQWVSLVLPELLQSEAKTFSRELVLPLDPPALKVMRVDVQVDRVKVEQLPHLLVSGETGEEVLYLGGDQRVHRLRHVTAWNYPLDGECAPSKGRAAATVKGEVLQEVLSQGGHTLRLTLAEKVKVQVMRDRQMKVLTPEGLSTPLTSTVVKAWQVVGEVQGSEILTVPITVSEDVSFWGVPRAQVRELAGEANPGQVVVRGSVEIQVPYVDADGKECAALAGRPLRLFIPAAAALPGQRVEIAGSVESIQLSRDQTGAKGVQVLCSFVLRLLTQVTTELVTAVDAPNVLVNTTRVEVMKLVGLKQTDQLLEHTLCLSERVDSLGEVTAHPRKPELSLVHGRVLASGKVELGVCYFTDDGREHCESTTVPWQAVVPIPETRPRMIPEAEVSAYIVLDSLSLKKDLVTVRLVLSLRTAVYSPTLTQVITGIGVRALTPTAGMPALAVVQEETELEALVVLRYPPACKVAEVSAVIERLSWRTEEGQVTATGWLSLSVAYTGRDGTLRMWQEERACELSFPCAAAREGLTVQGRIKVTEVGHQLLLGRGLTWGREVLAQLKLAADLVVIGGE